MIRTELNVLEVSTETFLSVRKIFYFTKLFWLLEFVYAFKVISLTLKLPQLRSNYHQDSRTSCVFVK